MRFKLILERKLNEFAKLGMLIVYKNPLLLPRLHSSNTRLYED
jgi:hypothetical protein